ncbi:MAG: hypothetical protein ACRES4_04500 [Nevskiales bacterium]
MTERTCAACDCRLDENSIKVKVGGRTVEVCCEDCARKLREAQASSLREMFDRLQGFDMVGVSFGWLRGLG